nr:uncharacterized protein LOC109742094 [Aegilops tauschii subsp. strangulata]
MDKFHDRQYVWLRSRVHGTYLHANIDGKSVSLHRRRAALRAAWAVHIHQGDAPEPYLLLYNAANGRYLAATATRAPPGHIGFRAEQRDYDQPQLQAVMWLAAETGFRDDVLLRNAGGRYLRANGKYTGKYLRLKNVTVDGINNVSTMMYWTVEPIPLRDPNSPLGLAPPTLVSSPERNLRLCSCRICAVLDVGFLRLDCRAADPESSPTCWDASEGLRRLIRFVRASAEGGFAEDGWSEFHFTGRSVYQLRNELYNRIGPHRPTPTPTSSRSTSPCASERAATGV